MSALATVERFDNVRYVRKPIGRLFRQATVDDLDQRSIHPVRQQAEQTWIGG